MHRPPLIAWKWKMHRFFAFGRMDDTTNWSHVRVGVSVPSIEWHSRYNRFKCLHCTIRCAASASYFAYIVASFAFQLHLRQCDERRRWCQFIDALKIARLFLSIFITRDVPSYIYNAANAIIFLFTFQYRFAFRVSRVACRVLNCKLQIWPLHLWLVAHSHRIQNILLHNVSDRCFC